MTSIFLSYARGDDEPFVERLYHALRARGLDVWWDRVCMPSRQLTFHQEIREAVATRERLVLVVGPRAVTSDYVRQEWMFALQNDKVVTPILRLGDYPLVPDELRLFHAEDFRDDARFDLHLDNLVRQLSEPPPPLGKLIAVPSLPAHYLARADRLNALRDALRADLDRPVVIGGAAARVGVHGMGGIGKSVLAAALAHDRKVREAFPDGISWIGLGSSPDVPALQRRVHRDLGGDGAFETEHQGKARLKELLADKAVLVVLDDVWRRGDVDWFDVLGPRCRALVTTRDMGLLTSLGGVHHVVELLTDYEAQGVLSLAAGVPRDGLPSEAAQIITECGRLPLAVALCGGMIRRGLTGNAVLQQLQQARIDRIADRHAVEAQHQSVWHAIHVSVEFLPADERQRFLELAVFPPDEATPEAAIGTLWTHTGHLDDWGTQELLAALGERSLVQLVTPVADPGQPPRRQAALHDLVYDYVQRTVKDAKALHDQLLAAYRAKCKDGWPRGPNDGYFFTHLRQHLIAAGRAGELADLLHELRWLEAKSEGGLTFDLTEDFHDALGALPADDSRCKMLSLLDEALRRDIHFIARHPTTLFQCLWNLCWWYDCPEAIRHYDFPKKGPARWKTLYIQLLRFLRRGLTGVGVLSRRNRQSISIFKLLEKWRIAKERRTPGCVWLRSLRPPALRLGTALKGILGGHAWCVCSVSYSPDGQRIVTSDGTVRIWDARSGAELLCLSGHTDRVNSVAFSPDGCRVVCGCSDETVRVWDARTGAELLCLRGHGGTAESGAGLLHEENQRQKKLDFEAPGSVASVAFAPDGQRLVSGARDQTIRVWDARSGTELIRLRGHTDRVTSVAFSPDGERLVSGSRDHTVRIWDARSGAELLCLRAHTSGVDSVAFSPDGCRVVSGCWNETARIWDARSGAELLCLRGYAGGVISVAFSPDGRRLVSGSWDETVRVWDARSGAELLCLRGHGGYVTSVAFAPSGEEILSGANDNTARVWSLTPGPAVTLGKHGDLENLSGSQAKALRFMAFREVGAGSRDEFRALRASVKHQDSVFGADNVM